MSRKDSSFGVASTGSIALQPMADVDETVSGAVPAVSPSQSPLPIDGKMT